MADPDRAAALRRLARRLLVPAGFLLVFIVLPLIAFSAGTAVFREPVDLMAEGTSVADDPHVWAQPD